MIRYARAFVPSLILAASLIFAPSVAAQRPAAVEAAPLVWPTCAPGQVEVLILGTVHFAQSSAIDVASPDRQKELRTVLARLTRWEPTAVAVEYPAASQAQLDSAFHAYLARPESDVRSRNEISQVGFRVARRSGHDRVYAVDVPMNLWNDSIQVFDDRWPRSRDSLRTRWPLRYDRDGVRSGGGSLLEILTRLNEDAVPGNSEMYAAFLPLVEEDVYAGALKLTPWYDRNLRIVQNLFRVSDPHTGRVLLVIGAGHLRVLKQMIEFTPQLCPVSANTVLGRPASDREAEGVMAPRRTPAVRTYRRASG